MNASVTGQLYIEGRWVTGEASRYRAHDPATGAALDPELSQASRAQVEAAVAAAEAAAPVLRNTSLQERAQFLRACADEIMALGDALIARVTAETGLPAARIEGERGRTCNQLRLFADYVLRGDFLDARIDTALPERKPLPRPDLRHVNVALGPVVVFGASNFPLAFSVAGGDTAAAFAAGCPVLVKGHSSHPGTSELVARAIAKAVAACGLPPGTFSLLMGAGADVGAALVQAPAVKAVGFTGSFAGGMALVKLANARPEPIPVFAEMGSVNPVVLLPQALAANAAEIARNFVASLTLGTGQFCTNPGLVFALDDANLDAFLAAASAALAEIPPGVMLNHRIAEAYASGLRDHGAHDGVRTIATGKPTDGMPGCRARAALLATSAEHFLRNPSIHEEVFGPAGLVVRCRNEAELKDAIAALRGQLTGTVHCAPGELDRYTDLVELLTARAGRVLVNGFPTGVEVCDAMVHGGPFPASTDSRFTSVGTNAIKRFLRPVCYQSFPEPLLPPALRNANPWNLNRLVNGTLTRDPI